MWSVLSASSAKTPTGDPLDFSAVAQFPYLRAVFLK
jgi:hypothetical protein